MKKVTILSLAIALSVFANAQNWVYNSSTSKWEKVLSASVLKFKGKTTTDVQSAVMAYNNGTSGYPSPQLTSSSGVDLSEGYLVVNGANVTAAGQDLARQGFCMVKETVGAVTGDFLRFAQYAATVNEGTVTGVTNTPNADSFQNLNVYLPTKYSYTGYTVNIQDSVYYSNPGTDNKSVKMDVMSETSDAALTAGTFSLIKDGTAVKTSTNGTIDPGTPGVTKDAWAVYSFTSTTSQPFRLRFRFTGASQMAAYMTSPRITLLSATEPVTRTVTVTANGNGTVIPAYATVRDQDVQTYTITPAAGSALNAITYNSTAVTPVDNGNGTYSYTTPLLKSDAALNVTFSSILTSVAESQSASEHVRVKGGAITVEGASEYQIFSVFGEKIDSKAVLKSGVYIVKTNTATQKVVVD